jgi:hypothetical protein
VISGGTGECSDCALFTLDGVDGATLRQGEREGAQSREQINNRTPRPYAGKDLFDQDCFSRLAGL